MSITMSRTITKEQTSAISREFATRLDHLDAKKTIRVVVMLQADNGKPSTHPTRQHRAGLVRKARKNASAALPSIDKILKRHHGKRLSEGVGPLGHIVVEAPPEGIRALAASEHVKAVLEDQSILRIPHHGR
ncbi:MAG: hypothetical protein WAV20_21650 [Blastocatellia bacterium]